MPNVSGMTAASEMFAAGTLPQTAQPYGRHCAVALRNNDAIALIDQATAREIAVVSSKGHVRIDLPHLTPLTAAAVNVFVTPYGKVKTDWRAAQRGQRVYYFAAAKGTAPIATPKPAPAAPQPAPAAPLIKVGTPVTPVAHQPAVAASPAPVAASPVAVPGEVAAPAKVASIKALTKTYSRVGAVLTTHQNLRALESAWIKRQANKPAGVIITGPAGTAKTRLAAEFAATKGVPFLKVDGSSIQTANDWYGQFVPAEGGFKWEWTPFALALQRGTPMVILVDEINRVENERALNGLMGLQDWTGTFTPVGAPSAVRLPAGVLIVATLNEGVEYVGTVEVDAAVRDRFGLGVRMEYPPENVEVRILLQEAPGLDKEVAKRLVRVAASQRGKRHDDTLYPSGNVISTRVLISVAEDITLCGAAPAEALWTAIRGRFIPEDEPALNVLIEAQFGAAPVDASTLADDDDLEMMLAAD